MQGEGEGQARNGASRCRRTAGNPGPRTAPTDDKWGLARHLGQSVQPTLVEYVRARSHPASRDPVGLLDPDDADPSGWEVSRQPGEITGLCAATRAMSEHQGCPCLVSRGQDHARRPVSGVHEERVSRVSDLLVADRLLGHVCILHDPPPSAGTD